MNFSDFEDPSEEDNRPGKAIPFIKINEYDNEDDDGNPVT